MITKKYYLYMMLFGFALTLNTACSSDDDDDAPSMQYGVPADAEAGEAPIVSKNTVNIPNISNFYVEEGTDGAVGNISFNGIKSIAGDFMKLAGTGDANQNIWMTIDGKPKSITIVNSEDVTRAAAKGQADIVFLVDNSGSMGQEADSVAKQIVRWSTLLSQTIDCKFGCVGYGDNSFGIDGGMNMDDISVLNNFLNNRQSTNYYSSGLVSGTNRTYGFFGYDSLRLAQNALGYEHFYNGGYNECGALALRFADSLFNFRDAANRVYINFTDEPNQPNGISKWSVYSLSDTTTIYDWSGARGTVHTIYSQPSDTLYFDEQGHYKYSYSSQPYWEEAPWMMSEYTGGLKIFADPYFKGVTLEGLEVTGALSNSYVLRFNITEDLKTGTHTIVITIKDKYGNEATKTFENIKFG